jgi:hypothetical protein
VGRETHLFGPYPAGERVARPAHQPLDSLSEGAPRKLEWLNFLHVVPFGEACEKSWLEQINDSFFCLSCISFTAIVLLNQPLGYLEQA